MSEEPLNPPGEPIDLNNEVTLADIIAITQQDEKSIAMTVPEIAQALNVKDWRVVNALVAKAGYNPKKLSLFTKNLKPNIEHLLHTCYNRALSDLNDPDNDWKKINNLAYALKQLIECTKMVKGDVERHVNILQVTVNNLWENGKNPYDEKIIEKLRERQG